MGQEGWIVFTHFRKIGIIVLPVVVAGFLLAFFGQPREAKTVVVNFEPQAGVSILHTTGFSCANKLPLEKFNRTYSAYSLLVNSSETSDFKLFLAANDIGNTCTKAELVSIDPTVYGQVVEDYEVDADKGVLKLDIGSKFSNASGVDSFDLLVPANLHLFVGFLALIWVVGAWITQYSKT